jgi:hypothetical protein
MSQRGIFKAKSAFLVFILEVMIWILCGINDAFERASFPSVFTFTVDLQR